MTNLAKEGSPDYYKRMLRRDADLYPYYRPMRSEIRHPLKTDDFNLPQAPVGIYSGFGFVSKQLSMRSFPDFRHLETHQPKTLEAAVAFYCRLFNPTGPTRQYLLINTPDTPEKITNWLELVSTDPTKHYYFIYYSDGIIGHVSWSQVGEKNAQTGTVLHHDFTGKGIGRWARSRAIELARNRGIRELISIVDEGNTRSRRLTEGLGFSDTGLRVGDLSLSPDDPGKNKLNHIVYKRILGDEPFT